MASVSIFKQRRVTLLLVFLSGILAFPVNAQVTRKKMLVSFHKATTYSNAGNTDKAIETLMEIAELVPKYPDTYLRMAEIYDNAGQKESAIVMYRKYINMEMNDDKVEEPSARLKTLEEELGMGHYEEEEEKQAKALFAKYNVMQQADGSETEETTASDDLQLFADEELERHPIGETADDAPNHANKDGRLTLFSLSALMDTRNESAVQEASSGTADVIVEEESQLSEQPEGLEEVIKEDVGEADSSTDEVLQEVTAVEEIVPLDEEFLAKAYLDSSNVALNVFSDEGDDCDTPLLIYAARPRLEKYGIARETMLGVNPQKVDQQSLSTILEGRWVSSECKKNGRETWILTISQTGHLWHVTLDDESGIYIEDERDLMDISWNSIKNIWSYDHAISNQIKELRAKTVTAEIKNDQFSYTFVTEHQQKPHKSIYTWGRNILDGIAEFIPFGGVVSQVGNTLINYVSEKDQQKTYTLELQFFVKAITANVLKCEYVVSERERSVEGNKLIDNYSKLCYLYKVDDYYHGFEFVSENEHDILNKKLYALLKNDADADVSKRFPLAYMYCFGAGTDKSLSKAVRQMQVLAEKGGCDRAKAWLIPFCYNLSMDEKAYSNRYVRKYFYNYADEALGDLLLRGYPYAYSLKADALMNDEKNFDQIVPLYEKAVSLGDVYALYRLGVVYTEGVIVERDVSKAMEYLTMAAEKGYADAYFELALLHKRGRLIERDYAKYIEFLYSAIDSGSIKALKELSEAYFLGVGVKSDFNVANNIKECYMRASDEEWKEVLNVYGYNTIL